MRARREGTRPFAGHSPYVGDGAGPVSPHAQHSKVQSCGAPQLAAASRPACIIAEPNPGIMPGGIQRAVEMWSGCDLGREYMFACTWFLSYVFVYPRCCVWLVPVCRATPAFFAAEGCCEGRGGANGGLP